MPRLMNYDPPRQCDLFLCLTIMQRTFPFLLFALVPLLTSCDRLFGIVRDAPVAFMPDPARVGAVIRAAPGVDNVQYLSFQEGRSFGLNGIEPGAHGYEFLYHGDTYVGGSLEFVEDYKHRVEYSQEHLGFRPPSQECIDATRPVMIRIEEELEESCGLTNLQASVIEHCIRMKCK